MAKHIFYNASVLVNGVDLSDHVEAVSLEVATTKVVATPYQSPQNYFQPGIQDVTDPVITFYQDYAPGKVYATFVGLWQNGTVFNLVLRADAGAPAVTNPQWTVPVFVSKWPVLGGTRGNRHMAPINCTIGGLIMIQTS